jgi:CheY-like chemotaxis protein
MPSVVKPATVSSRLKLLKRLRLLVVDDQPTLAEGFGDALLVAGAGYVVVATSAGEAFELIDQGGWKIDCIIADEDMKPMTGLRMLREIRSGKQRGLAATTPFVILTGQPVGPIRKIGKLLDIQAVFTKPIAVMNLLEGVVRAVSDEFSLKLPEHYNAVAVR